MSIDEDWNELAVEASLPVTQATDPDLGMSWLAMQGYPYKAYWTRHTGGAAEGDAGLCIEEVVVCQKGFYSSTEMVTVVRRVWMGVGEVAEGPGRVGDKWHAYKMDLCPSLKAAYVRAQEWLKQGIEASEREVRSMTRRIEALEEERAIHAANAREWAETHNHMEKILGRVG